ncbi:LysR substrate-binding domain-containing protein [Photobacterium sp. 1_MG-2023]|uniref:LysR substrate-binding domain-containing protein n=1 Tax=Photobacterium sp. 1_MG-2023 TaxID=3062646 RepID=UPI0026E333CE|nr:LysR substrate-binding domain-containing protein [Photobacterium sp. 1_MG-2023]MDO6706861.1 LysR substrate-binding domain-containing protein [Photobacterium sp. 1_MG-2023]
MRLPSTRELQAFLITAEHLNFTVAAKQLNVTQGAVSRQIQALEAQLKVRLFQRHARGLTLTTKGNEFLPLVQQLLTQLQKAVDQVSNEKQQIKLKAPSCITSWLLPKLMTFQQAHPDIDVALTSAIMHNVHFASEPFDAAICYTEQPPQKDMKAFRLFDEYLSPLCAPGLLRPDADLVQLSQQTWLHATAQQTDWKIWLDHVGYQGKLATQNQRFATLDLAVSAAIQGFGIAVGDVELARQDLNAGRLVMPFPQRVPSGKSYFLVRPNSAPTPALSLLFDWILEDTDPGMLQPEAAD